MKDGFDSLEDLVLLDFSANGHSTFWTYSHQALLILLFELSFLVDDVAVFAVELLNSFLDFALGKSRIDFLVDAFDFCFYLRI